MTFRAHVVIALALVSASCRTVGDTPEDSSSDVKFLDNWDPSTCIVAHVDKPSLRVCVDGTGDIAHAQKMTEMALKQWLAPLQARYQNIATTIEFGCDHPDATVIVSSGSGTGWAGPGFVKKIFDSSELGTWLHEFGHAFACLGDTYVGGQAGACLAGQPKSVMCWGLLLNNLTEDDVNGVLQQYLKLGSQAALAAPEGDEDKDGIINAQDKCPGTIAGAVVWHDQQDGKWRGCGANQSPVPLPVPIDPSADDDGDSVANKSDHCPATPHGAVIWQEQENGQWRGCATGQTPILLP